MLVVIHITAESMLAIVSGRACGHPCIHSMQAAEFSHSWHVLQAAGLAHALVRAEIGMVCMQVPARSV